LPGAEIDLGALLTVVELRHPHLVVMRPLPGQLGFEPEMAGGERLSQLCRVKYASRPIPLRFGLRILLDTLSGLAALHGAKKNGRPLGLSHGQVAPSNIVVGRDGIARLIPVVNAHWDKGALPNPEASGYAAPEKLRGDDFDQRADTFSAGVMLWEMITGRSFRGLPAEIITAWVVDGKVPDPLQPDDAPWVVSLATVATTALAVDPAQRWSHVGLMGAEIEAIVDGHMASTVEVARLLVDGRDAPSPESIHTPSPPAPSLSPTAMSIPPAPPSVRPPPWQASATSSRDTLSYEYEQAPTSASPFQIPALPELSSAPVPEPRASRKARSQPLIAWSTMAVALVLLGVAAHELFGNPGAGEPAPARPPAVQPVAAPQPVPPESQDRGSPSVGAAAAQANDQPLAEPAPTATSLSPAYAAVPSPPPSAKPGPRRKVAPPPGRKGPKRDDQFGI
jgi:serine/threonine protein kinase